MCVCACVFVCVYACVYVVHFSFSTIYSDLPFYWLSPLHQGAFSKVYMHLRLNTVLINFLNHCFCLQFFFTYCLQHLPILYSLLSASGRSAHTALPCVPKATTASTVFSVCDITLLPSIFPPKPLLPGTAHPLCCSLEWLLP